jgi:hypothetical protein
MADEAEERERAAERYVRLALDEDPAPATDPMTVAEVSAIVATLPHARPVMPLLEDYTFEQYSPLEQASEEERAESYRRAQGRALVRLARAERARRHI